MAPSSLFTLLMSLLFLSPATSFLSLQIIASQQLNFWSLNVETSIIDSILKKLSPLTMQESNFYTNMMTMPGEFVADSRFCALANLVCDSKPDILPCAIASYIPLKSETISKMFPQITAVKSMKLNMEMSLFHCNARAVQKETKSCPSSLEGMIEFVKLTLGAEKLLPLPSDITKGWGNESMIGNVTAIHAKRFVGCHEVFLPFAVYFCHSSDSSQLYRVEFVDPKTVATAICHMDTSAWPKEHMAFHVQKISPGQGEACHWLTDGNLAWIDGGGQ